MASRTAPVPGAATGAPPSGPSPCTASCSQTCSGLIDLLTEKIKNVTHGTSACPVETLAEFCKAVLEERGPPTGKGRVHDVQSSQDLIQDAGNDDVSGEREQTLNEFQIIRAVVMGVVTFIILVFICKMVFQLFVRYSAKADDRGH